jgi:chromate reductase
MTDTTTDDVNPDDDHGPLAAPVAELRRQLAESDALLLSTPEYVGALPGSFKNLLDWTVGAGVTYEMPVAWVNVAASPTGATDAHESLRLVMGRSARDIVEAACVRIPVTRAVVGSDGLIPDERIRAEIAGVLTAPARRVREPD